MKLVYIQILSEEEFQMYDKKSRNQIKSLLHTTYQCQAPDCGYFCEVLPNTRVKKITCPKCNAKNCLSCQAIHGKEKCKDYKLRMKSTDIGKSIQAMEVSCILLESLLIINVGSSY